MTLTRSFRHLLIAISISNLFFTWAWSILLGPDFLYTMNEAFGWRPYVTAMSCMLMLAFVLWAAGSAILRSGMPLATHALRWLFVGLSFVALNAIRQQAPVLSLGAIRAVLGWIGLGCAGLASLAALAYIARRRDLPRICATMILMLFPFAIMTFAQSLYHCFTPGAAREALRDSPSLPELPAPPARSLRIVWVVFDGWDYRLAFAARPKSLKLPVLDELKRTAVFATNAVAPGKSTMESFPGFITGRQVKFLGRKGRSDIMLTLEPEGAAVRWSRLPNIFDEARTLRANAALMGSWHPYCRVLGDRVPRCHSEPFYVERRELSPLERITEVASTIPFVFPLVYRLGVVTGNPSEAFVEAPIEAALDRHRANASRALRWLADPNYRLVFLHFSIPHNPFIYDKAAGKFTAAGDSNYLDNLAAVDRTVADILKALKDSKLDQRTVLLLTSDHPVSDVELLLPHMLKDMTEDDLARFHADSGKNVPFFVKLPGQERGILIENPVNGLIAHEIARTVLRSDRLSLDKVQELLRGKP